MSYCGVRDDDYPDALPMGFPFHRPFHKSIDEDLLTQPNVARRKLIVRWIQTDEREPHYKEA